MAAMGVNPQILGMQLIPRLAEKLEVEVKFPTQAFTMSLSLGFKKLFEDCGRILILLPLEIKKRFARDFSHRMGGINLTNSPSLVSV